MFGNSKEDRYDQRLLSFVRQSDLVPVSQLESFVQADSFLRGLRDGLSDRQDPESLQRAIDDIDAQIEVVEDTL